MIYGNFNTFEVWEEYEGEFEEGETNTIVSELNRVNGVRGYTASDYSNMEDY